jgi:hypothetical protein
VFLAYSCYGFENLTNLNLVREDYNAFGRTLALDAGDVDNDGFKDVIVAVDYRYYTYALVLKGPSLSLASSLQLNAVPNHLVLRDINNDEYLDILTANQFAKTIGVSLGSEQGFQNFSYISTGEQFPNYLATGDFDEDGCPDLAFTNWAWGMLIVTLGDCEGNFEFSQAIQCGGGSQKVEIADFDLDDNLDLVVANMNTNDVLVAFGDGNGKFNWFRHPYVKWDAYTPAICDFNNDHYPDIIVGTHRGIVSVRNRGDGSFYRYQIIDSLNKTKYFTAAQDVTQDGNCDFVATAPLNNTVGLFLGDGNGDFRLIAGALSVEQPNIPLITDMDNDQDLDIIVFGSEDFFSLYRNPLNEPHARKSLRRP